MNEVFLTKFAPKRALLELALSRFLNVIGGAMFALFSSIYLYESGVAPWIILFGHGIGYLVRVFMTPLAGKFAARFGSEVSIAMALPFTLVNYGALILVPAWFPAFILHIFFYQWALSFYWTGLHTDMAMNSQKGARGKEYSFLSILTLLGAAIGPLIGGYIAEGSSFVVLLVLAGFVQALALIPLFSTKEKVTSYVLPFWQSFRLLRMKEMRRLFLGLLGWGEEMLFMFLWPIFVFLIVQDYTTFGWIATAATLATGAFTFIAGVLVDTRSQKSKRRQKGLQRFSTIVVSGIWVMRSFASTAFQVFVLDTGAKYARSMLGVMYSTKVYDRTDTVDKIATIVLWQQGVALGEGLAGLVGALILLLFAENLALAFLPAAAFSLLLLLL